jgi:hypothetical protein
LVIRTIETRTHSDINVGGNGQKLQKGSLPAITVVT